MKQFLALLGDCSYFPLCDKNHHLKKVMNGCPVSNVSCRELRLRFSSIDSSVAFNFDRPLAFCRATVCIIPSNFAINSSVFEPI